MGKAGQYFLVAYNKIKSPKWFATIPFLASLFFLSKPFSFATIIIMVLGMFISLIATMMYQLFLYLLVFMHFKDFDDQSTSWSIYTTLVFTFYIYMFSRGIIQKDCFLNIFSNNI